MEKKVELLQEATMECKNLEKGLFTATSYALNKVNKLLQKRAVLYTVQGFSASPKQG